MSDTLTLQACGKEIQLSPDAPLLMGIVNASPNSFSDAGQYPTIDDQLRLAHQLCSAGAVIIDVGGETAAGGKVPVNAEVEASRVVPLIRQIVGSTGVPVSIDTYKPAVAAAAIKAGATIVNDVSGLSDPTIADICADTGAGIVIMHTRIKPKGTLLDPDFYDDVIEDVIEFFHQRMSLAISRGVSPEQIILDPGPDFAKTPAQTVAVLQAMPRIHELGRPILWAVSRKDFIGAITGEGPDKRLAGTLAALAYGRDARAHIFRVHDVAAAADFFAVRDVLHGKDSLHPRAGLTPDRYPDGILNLDPRRPTK